MTTDGIEICWVFLAVIPLLKHEDNLHTIGWIRSHIQPKSMKDPKSNRHIMGFFTKILIKHFWEYFAFSVFRFLYIQSFSISNVKQWFLEMLQDNFTGNSNLWKRILTSPWRRQCRKWRNRSWQIGTETSWKWKHPPILSEYGVVLMKSKTVIVQCCSKVK